MQRSGLRGAFQVLGDMRRRTRGADGSMQGAGANIKKDEKKRRGQPGAQHWRNWVH